MNSVLLKSMFRNVGNITVCVIGLLPLSFACGATTPTQAFAPITPTRRQFARLPVFGWRFTTNEAA